MKTESEQSYTDKNWEWTVIYWLKLRVNSFVLLKRVSSDIPIKNWEWTMLSRWKWEWTLLGSEWTELFWWNWRWTVWFWYNWVSCVMLMKLTVNSVIWWSWKKCIMLMKIRINYLRSRMKWVMLIKLRINGDMVMHLRLNCVVLMKMIMQNYVRLKVSYINKRVNCYFDEITN